ncbi:MAG: patatin-like phospholipase family protein [Bacteroidales bacterium]|jgi:NTE family protein|nr:patatin-like phospholipase family protein [Bacteroidales bacterium]
MSVREVINISKIVTGRKTVFKSLLYLFLGFFISHSGLAQDPVQRPGIGLVLSGGGAHGIAHVGVLKVMEEAGLRPDFVTGTSMGSIIGGYYSLGYSADSMKKILKIMDWDLILSNTIPQDKIIFLEKDHFNNSIMSFPLLFRKVKLPSGLISGQQLENSLSYYAWPAADINDFSKLPIPFMCVGTDLITVREVDLKTGYLADALRASSAIPTVFAPLKIDTALLTDGGLINNFPAREIKDMGADIIIGSYVGFHNYEEEELNSIAGIIKQLSFSRSIDNFNEQKKLVDLLILPDIKGISLLEFSPVDTIFQRGYKAALPYKEYFRKLADSLDRYGGQKSPGSLLDKQYYSFDKVEIIGNSTIPDKQILGILDIMTGELVDKSNLYEKIELLYGKAWFDKVKYKVEPRNDSLILVIECAEKPKSMVDGSAHYDNSLAAGILLSFSIKNLLTPRSVINLDSYLGRYYRIRNSYLQFIDRNQKFGVSLDFYADNTLVPKINLKNETGDVISNNLSSGIGINRMFGLNQMMSISFDFEKRYLMTRYVSEIDLKYISYNYITTNFDYKINTLNSRHFPDRGIIVDISAGASDLTSGSIKKGLSRNVYNNSNPGGFSFDRFYTIRGNYKQYFTSNDRFTISLSGDALYITDCDSASSQNNFFLLGGIKSLNERSVPMVGFHPNEIPVKKMAGFGMELDWEILRDLHINLTGNIFAAREADRGTGYSLLAGYGIGIGYMSLMGPLRAGIMQGFYKQEKYFNQIKAYISVGYQF